MDSENCPRPRSQRFVITGSGRDPRWFNRQYIIFERSCCLCFAGRLLRLWLASSGLHVCDEWHGHSSVPGAARSNTSLLHKSSTLSPFTARAVKLTITDHNHADATRTHALAPAPNHNRVLYADLTLRCCIRLQMWTNCEWIGHGSG